MSNKLQLVVEGHFDKKLASNFLSLAGIPLDRIDFIVANGPLNVKNQVAKLRKGKPNSKVAILIDLDSNDNFEPEKKVASKYNIDLDSAAVFTAIPTIESWLFADIEAAKKKVKNKKRADELLSRIPLPDDIPYPKFLATRLFNFKEEFLFADGDIDLDIAASRSPSLRKFISGIGELLNVEPNVNWEKEYVRSAGRDIFSKLVDEVISSDSIIYKTLDGKKISAGEMSRNIHNGTDLGLRYSVEVLRIARDLLSREARKK